jgi:hypothetical protein
MPGYHQYYHDQTTATTTKANTRLVSLSLLGNRLTDDTAVWFRTILSNRNVTLTALNLKKNEDIQDVANLVEIKQLLLANAAGNRPSKDELMEEVQRSGGGMFVVPSLEKGGHPRPYWMPPASRPTTTDTSGSFGSGHGESRPTSAEKRRQEELSVHTSRARLLERMTELELVIADAEIDLRREQGNLRAARNKVENHAEDAKTIQARLDANERIIVDRSVDASVQGGRGEQSKGCGNRLEMIELKRRELALTQQRLLQRGRALNGEKGVIGVQKAPTAVAPELRRGQHDVPRLGPSRTSGSSFTSPAIFSRAPPEPALSATVFTPRGWTRESKRGATARMRGQNTIWALPSPVPERTET